MRSSYTEGNRLGLYWEGNLPLKSIGPAFSWKEIYVSNLQKVVTETCPKDADRTKTLPCKYFFKMERGNPSQELPVNCANSNIHVIVIWQMQKFLCHCTVFALLYFEFEGNFQVRAPGIYIWRGNLTEGFLRYEFGGLISEHYGT